MLFAMICAHALCDYPLQGDFLAKAKNKFNPIPGVPWWQALFAHGAIHGGAVYLITGLWWLGVVEMIWHAHIDHAKCKGELSYNVDQALHIMLKVLWCGLAWAVAV